MRTHSHTPRMPLFWWLRRASYLRYMLRELTCVPIAAWIVVATAGLVDLVRGPAAWQGFLHGMASPAGFTFQLIVLIAGVYHAVTWFALAPRTMPLNLGGRQVPGSWIQGAHYALLLAILVAVFVLVEI
ncbi:MAG TPA: fumarate reductase subunit C [Gammaproteobacteria bacterium]|nr:fumarate reductase subunit C [Gammaproteobacteria bacterium]